MRLSPPLFSNCMLPLAPKTPTTLTSMGWKTAGHTTETLVTLAVATPVPKLTVQVWLGPEGWVKTVTLYAPFTGTRVGNVNVPFFVIARLSPPLFCRTKPVPPAYPDTEPPIESVPSEQVTCTLTATPAVAVPLPLVTVQVCAGVVGWVETVTL